jgi:hypothetical protein
MQDRSTYFLQQNRQIDPENIYIPYKHTNVEIETVAALFLFWEYLFRILGIWVLCNARGDECGDNESVGVPQRGALYYGITEKYRYNATV